MCNSDKGRIIRVTIILSLFLITPEVTAQDFKTYESGVCIFNLQGCELSPAVEKGIVFGISLILKTYKDTFGFYYPKDYKVKVTIFKDKNKFMEYQKNQTGSIVSHLGYYSGRYRETVVLWKKSSKKTKDAQQMVSTVFHEANHMILGHHIPWCPLWINEGLSEYFDGLNVFGKNKRIYLQKKRSRWCKYWLKKGFPIKLDKYISLNHEEWNKFRRKDVNAAYTIGYSLVYFLMSGSDTEKVLKELLWEFKRESKNADSMKIINEHYPGGFVNLEKQWKKWIPEARSYRPLRALRERTDARRMSSTLKGELAEEQKQSSLWSEVLNAYTEGDFKRVLDSIEKIAQEDSENYYVFEVWGNSLLLYAEKAGTGDKNKKIELTKQAEEKYLKVESIEKGHCAYNLACIRAFFGDEEGCRKWLEVSEETKNLPTLEYAQNDEDLKSVRDKDWFKKVQWKK